MVEMSTMCGRLDSVNVPSVSRLAAMRGKEAFFAPPMGMVPCNGMPPETRMRSMGDPRSSGPKEPGAAGNRTKRAFGRAFVPQGAAGLKRYDGGVVHQFEFDFL